MNAAKDIFAAYPQQLQANTAPNSPVYSRLPGFYAVHGWQPGTPGAAPVQTFAEEAIALLQGEPDPAEAAAVLDKLSPVYTLGSGGASGRSGSPAVPTGRVFIRFADGVNVGDRETEIGQADYEVDQKLDYAPNAAWLRARSGRIADALNGIDLLRKIADVENVEPQLLMEAYRR